MPAPPPAPVRNLAIMEEIMQCYIEHHPDRFDTCKPFLLEIHTMIEDYKELLTRLYENDKRQSLLILILANRSNN